MALRRPRLLAPLLLALTAAAPASSRQVPPARSPVPAAKSAKAAPGPRQIAERIAAEHLAVKNGQIILVAGEVQALDFLEELSVAVARQGGSPLQSVGTERLALRLYEEVPEKYDKMRHAWFIELAELVDGIVRVDARATPHLLASIPAARRGAAEKTDADVASILRDRSVPLLVVGNGLWPTAATAKVHGLTEKQLAGVFWAAMATPPDSLRAAGGAVKAAIRAGKSVRVTHPGGTDLTFSVEERPVVVSDGTSTPELLAADVVETHLPAGEVLVAPVRETAKGKLVLARLPFEGGWLEQFVLEFDGGRVVKHSGRPGDAYRRFVQLYDAAPEVGRDELALFVIGVNAGARAPKGKALVSSIPAGTVTVGIGNNTRGGGETNIPFSFVAPLAGATVTVDERVIVKAGVLAVEQEKAAAR